MMNYFQKKKLAFMSIVNKVKGFIRTITGTLPLTLEGCVDEESIIDYTLYGQSVQDGTPTPETPVEVESVGEFDESTGKYKIPIKVSGKNIANFSIVSNQYNLKTEKIAPNIFKVTKTNNEATAYGQIETYVETGKTYTLFRMVESEKSIGNIPAWKSYNAASVYTYRTPTYYTFTATQEKFILGLYPNQSANLKGLETTFTFMLVEGSYAASTFPDYEPYHKPITTNIYLDEPLRKVGDYADYIDFENGKVVRNVEKYTFTGKETDQGGATNDPTCFGYVIQLSNLSLSSNKVGLCNYLKLGATSTSGANRFAYLGIANHPYVYVYFKKTDFPELETYSPTTAKQVVKQMYDSGVPMILYYNRNKPTETPITLPTIPTFKGTSIISTDTTIQPSNVEITYYSNVKE